MKSFTAHNMSVVTVYEGRHESKYSVLVEDPVTAQRLADTFNQAMKQAGLFGDVWAEKVDIDWRLQPFTVGQAPPPGVLLDMIAKAKQ